MVVFQSGSSRPEELLPFSSTSWHPIRRHSQDSHNMKANKITTLDDCENIHHLRSAAMRRLPRSIFEYIDRGSEDETLLVANRDSLNRIRIIPRYPEHVNKRRSDSVLFGKPLTMPLSIAPTATAGLVSYEGELDLARAAAKAGVPFTLATPSMTSVEKIGRLVPEGRNWLQLYLWRDLDLSRELINRAAAAGFEAIIFTVDTPVPPNREYNRYNGFTFPYRPSLRSIIDMLSAPRWLFGTLGKYLLQDGHMPRFENYPEGYRTSITGNPVGNQIETADYLSWDHVTYLRKYWKGILMVKGILHPADAIQAVDRGADAVVVSNHGGRNLDCAIPAIDALPDIVEAVGSKATVLFDSGVRRGTDIIKAVALGADAVMAGRATLYGAAVAGEEGASKALAILRHELLTAMANIGVNTIAELGSLTIAKGTSYR